MDQRIEQVLRNLLTGIASTEEVGLLKQKLASGQISIGGNVSQSIIILGKGNTVQILPRHWMHSMAATCSEIWNAP